MYMLLCVQVLGRLPLINFLPVNRNRGATRSRLGRGLPGILEQPAFEYVMRGRHGRRCTHPQISLIGVTTRFRMWSLTPYIPKGDAAAPNSNLALIVLSSAHPCQVATESPLFWSVLCNLFCPSYICISSWQSELPIRSDRPEMLIPVCVSDCE